MNPKKKEELGKGIRALLSSIDTDMPAQDNSLKGNLPSNAISNIPLDQIEINPFQPRADFDEISLAELSDSIRVHGIIQPVTLRRISNKKYQLIAGERRLRASKMAGLTEIPAYIRTANDQEMLEIALIENIQRENLNAMEIAINYKRLMDECSLTQEELGERVGKDRSTVTNYLRLLKLPPDIQAGIKNRHISMGHARALVNVTKVEDQLSIFKDILKHGLSVRKVEEIVRHLEQSPKKKDEVAVEQPKLPTSYQKVQDELSSRFGTRVTLKRNKNGKGQIIIPFLSENDLNRVLDILDID